jgi:uroporphyrinogen decarboxylase
MPILPPSHRLINAFLKQPVDMTPVWLMRQAGRYLPEYRALREKAGDFMTMCKTPDLACEITLQPLRRFALDAAILFSDILTIPDAMGLGLHFVQHEGPKFARPLSSAAEINKLAIPDPSQELRYVIDAINLVKKNLQDKLPLIGFAGSPWTLATYMIEGGSSDSFSKAKKILYQQPRLMHNLLAKLAISVTTYLNAQIHAGVDAVMLFDTWGGILSTTAYHDFSLYYMQEIIAGLTKTDKTVPCVIFTKHGGQWLQSMANSGCHVIGLDWTTDIGRARELVGSKVALQGNLDPAILHTDATTIREEVAKILHAYGNYPGHVFNLGHGIHPDVPYENVSILVDAVHELSKDTHD